MPKIQLLIKKQWA